MNLILAQRRSAVKRQALGLIRIKNWPRSALFNLFFGYKIIIKNYIIRIMIKKMVINSISLLGLIPLLFFNCSQLMADTPLLKVGMELSYPPFEMIGTDGRPTGISVEMAENLGQFLGREVSIQNISFIGLIPSLNSDKIDLIISSLTVDSQREKAIDFSEPYASTGLCLLLNIKSEIKNIEEANVEGKIVVVKSGTTGEIYAAKNLKKATVRILDKESLCVLEVIQGKADAFIYDQLSVYTHWQKNPKTLKALLTPFHKEQWAIGLKKGNKELLMQVNFFLKKFREEGGFNKLAEKYLSEQKAAFEKLGIPFII
jgi:polar amino acid transport system substrate-binding protein